MTIDHTTYLLKLFFLFARTITTITIKLTLQLQKKVHGVRFYALQSTHYIQPTYSMLLTEKSTLTNSFGLTLRTVFEHISKHLEFHQKFSTSRRFFNSFLGVWKCDQTLAFRPRAAGVHSLSKRNRKRLCHNS